MTRDFLFPIHYAIAAKGATCRDGKHNTLKSQRQHVETTKTTCCLFHLRCINVLSVNALNSHELKITLHSTPPHRNILFVNRIRGCRVGVETYTRVYHCPTKSYGVPV